MEPGPEWVRWDPALSAKEPPRGALQRPPYCGVRDALCALVTRPILRRVCAPAEIDLARRGRFFAGATKNVRFGTGATRDPRPKVPILDAPGRPRLREGPSGYKEGALRETVGTEGPIAAPRLLLADDHDFMRAGLRFVLEAKTDLVIVGEAADGEEAVAMCREIRPDLVLMDITMPKMDGIEATRLIKAEMPHTAVLVLTSHVAEDVLMEAIGAGAAGYVLKGSGYEEVVGAVEAVLDGETPLDQGLAMRLLRRLSAEPERNGRARGGSPPVGASGPSAPSPLTPRELEVLALLATGRTNRQMATELHLSLSTVKRHVEHIIAKLGVSDRTQAAVRAGELGLLPAPNR